MASQQERLQAKIDRLARTISKEYAATQPQISILAFNKDDWLPDGTVKPHIGRAIAAQMAEFTAVQLRQMADAKAMRADEASAITGIPTHF